MYRYCEDEIDIVMIKDVGHFQKYDYDVINCRAQLLIEP